MATTEKVKERIYWLTRPWYVLRPQQVVDRITREWSGGAPDVVHLPWGLDLRVDPSDHIGSTIVRTGVYDLIVSESLLRLTDRGETTIDAGANIGYMTSLLAAASGPSGRVIAIEPHPALLDRLRSNITLWSGGSVTASVMVEAVALSSERGTGQLSIGDDFGRNAGIGSLEHGSTDEADCRTIDVRLERLDMLIADDVHIGVMKVDVEGHEEHLFEGASRLLEAGRVRDIVFEEHHSLPSPVSELLEGYGYTLFALEQRYLRPQLSPAHAGTSAASGSPSYVATKDPARALARFHRVGWKSLGH